MSISSDMLRSISTPETLETRLARSSSSTARRAARPSTRSTTTSTSCTRLNVVSSTAFQGRRRTPSTRASSTAGVEDNAIVIFSGLMDSESLFLTANADTVYFVGIVDLTKGRWCSRRRRRRSARIDDMWWRWVIDFGVPGPGPRRGWAVPARAARLRRPAAGGRLLRRALAHDAGADARPRPSSRTTIRRRPSR